jgi:hypothetical protein
MRKSAIFFKETLRDYFLQKMLDDQLEKRTPMAIVGSSLGALGALRARRDPNVSKRNLAKLIVGGALGGAGSVISDMTMRHSVINNMIGADKPVLTVNDKSIDRADIIAALIGAGLGYGGGALID